MDEQLEAIVRHLAHYVGPDYGVPAPEHRASWVTFAINHLGGIAQDYGKVATALEESRKERDAALKLAYVGDPNSPPDLTWKAQCEAQQAERDELLRQISVERGTASLARAHMAQAEREQATAELYADEMKAERDAALAQAQEAEQRALREAADTIGAIIACAERDCDVNPQFAGGLQPVIALLHDFCARASHPKPGRLAPEPQR